MFGVKVSRRCHVLVLQAFPLPSASNPFTTILIVMSIASGGHFPIFNLSFGA